MLPLQLSTLPTTFTPRHALQTPTHPRIGSLACSMATEPSPPTTSAAPAPHPPHNPTTNPRKRPRHSMQGYETVASATVDAEGRLDKAVLRLLAAHLPTASAAKKAVRRHEILLNGTRLDRTDAPVKQGDLLEWQQRRGAAAAQPAWRAARQETPIVVVYEDDHMACIIKPPGWITRGGKPGKSRGLCIDSVLGLACAPSPLLGAYREPRPVHRLDGPTGGLLLVAKTAGALKRLAADFAARRVLKRYQAVLWGRLEGQGVVDAPLGGQPSRTSYKALRSVEVEDDEGSMHVLTVVDMWPKTGRTHQLRKHMALVGHPLVGDGRYTSGFLQMQPDRVLEHDKDAPVDAAPLEPAATVADTYAAVVPAECRSLDNSFCLWAVELQVHHPEDGRVMCFRLQGVPLREAVVKRIQEDDAAEQLSGDEEVE